jgi:hypothetical protein
MDEKSRPIGWSLDRWRACAPKPSAKGKEGCHTLIDGCDLILREFTENAPDATLVDGSQMVDQREGRLGEATRTGSEWRVEKPFARITRDWHDADERKALVADDVGIAHHDAGLRAALFVTDRGVELDHDHGAPGNLTLDPAPNPDPEPNEPAY